VIGPRAALATATLRFYRQHPAQLALALLGVALGAALMVAVAVANRAALESFDHSIAVLAGPMTHEIVPREGAVLHESLYRTLRVERGLRESLPLLDVEVAIGTARVRLLGIDPLALAAAPAAASDADAGALLTLLSEPGAVLFPAALAGRLGLAPGAEFSASSGSRSRSLHVVGLRAVADDAWFADSALADIAVVQDLAGRRTELDRILLRLDDTAARSLSAALPPQVELRDFDSRRETFAAMTRAFRINLTAMSLLGVWVGAFLVYNAMSFAVVQRRRVFASLRLIGVTARQLWRLLLLEAALLGVLGALLGVCLGLVLGQSLLLLVTRTVSDLYVEIRPLAPDIPLGQLLTAAAVTLGAVVLATLGPARRAAQVPPVGLLREPAAPGLGGWRVQTAAALALMLGCPLLIRMSTSLAAGFGALFLLLLGYSLLLPVLLHGLLGLLQSVLATRLAPLTALVLRGVQSALPRLAPAIVALTIAVSATVGVAIMIDSFRASVADWLGTTLHADLYVYAAGPGEGLDASWRERLRALPGVAGVSAGRVRQLVLDGEPTQVLVLDGDTSAARGFDLLSGGDAALHRVLDAGEGLLVSEPLASRRGFAPGTVVQLQTPRGTQPVEILGSYRDYGNSRGAAVMSYAYYATHWDDTALGTLALRLSPQADARELGAAIETLGAASGSSLAVQSAGAIRERSLAIFDRTFAVTEVLRLLVVLVAFVGIVSALLALFLERRREFAILRATGMTPAQLLRLLLGQAGVSGLLAGLLALPLGLLLSLLLIDVINRRSFGWSMQTQVDPLILLQAVLLSLAAALLAAWWPARRLAAADLRGALEEP
jgi:putative ABC transport system permease protein